MNLLIDSDKYIYILNLHNSQLDVATDAYNIRDKNCQRGNFSKISRVPRKLLDFSDTEEVPENFIFQGVDSLDGGNLFSPYSFIFSHTERDTREETIVWCDSPYTRVRTHTRVASSPPYVVVCASLLPEYIVVHSRRRAWRARDSYDAGFDNVGGKFKALRDRPTRLLCTFGVTWRGSRSSLPTPGSVAVAPSRVGRTDRRPRPRAISLHRTGVTLLRSSPSRESEPPPLPLSSSSRSYSRPSDRATAAVSRGWRQTMTTTMESRAISSFLSSFLPLSLLLFGVSLFLPLLLILVHRDTDSGQWHRVRTVEGSVGSPREPRKKRCRAGRYFDR